MEEGIQQVPLDIFRHYLLRSIDLSKHPQHDFIQTLTTKYSCFQDKPEPRWHKHHHHQKPISKRTERTKIGLLDTAPETLLKKELHTLLNKLTYQNQDTLINKLKKVFQPANPHLFTSVIYHYLKTQPTFQPLYFHVLDQVIPDSTDLWTDHWHTYQTTQEWYLPPLPEQHDYDTLCAYLKRKNQTLALAQAWGHMISYHFVDIDPTDWFEPILSYATSLTSYETLDCYIDQMKEFYNSLPESDQKMIRNMYTQPLKLFMQYDLPKICYFKLLDFIALLE